MIYCTKCENDEFQIYDDGAGYYDVKCTKCGHWMTLKIDEVISKNDCCD